MICSWLKPTVQQAERRYSCDKCCKSFANKGTLRAHVTSVHEKVDYRDGKMMGSRLCELATALELTRIWDQATYGPPF